MKDTGFRLNYFSLILILGMILPLNAYSQEGLPESVEDLSKQIERSNLPYDFNTENENYSNFDDFGAETIEGDNAEFVRPLPPSEVEEQNEQDSVVASNNENSSSSEQSINQALSEDEGDLTTVLNVKDADISSLVKTFGKLTKRNYIIDGNVKGKITVLLENPVTLDESLRILDSILLLKGFTTVPVAENTWKVIPTKDAQQTTVPLIKGKIANASDVLVTEIVRLKYVPAEEMKSLISPFVSKGGTITSFEGTNSIIFIDSSANTQRLKELVNELDVPAVDQEITIIPIQHAEAGDIAEKLTELLGEDAKSNSVNNNLNNIGRARLNNFNQRNNTNNQASGGTRGAKLKVLPDERTNSIIVVADEDTTLKIRAIVEQLDSSVDLSGGRFYVHKLQHADAEELSEIINNLISGAQSTGTENSSSNRGSSLSRSQSTTNSNNSNNSSRRAELIESIRNKLNGVGSSAGRVNFEGEVSLTADPSTNSLIINASKADYYKLKEVINELDTKRRQVLVEATILEVSLNKEEGIGVELQGSTGTNSGGVLAQTDFGSIDTLLTNPAALSDLTIAAASSGTVTLPGGITVPSQAALVTAISNNSNVNVLSAPTILATDNDEAEIVVGENVPFVTSTATNTTNIANTFNQIQRQDVGITLRITPQISSSDFINLKIFVEISNVVNGTRNDPNGPTTTIRTTETNVEVKDSQMIVTGGLISDNVTESSRGIPFLMDIPVLGNLFRRDDVIQRRTNLLVFITPRIVEDQFEARRETKKLSGKLKNALDEQKSNFDRSDILDSYDIDNVVEKDTTEIIKPSTIIPPKESTLSPQIEEELLESNDEELIDLNVTPTLPEQEASEGKEIANTKSPMTYIILQDVSKKNTKAQPPFSAFNKSKQIALAVLGELGSMTSEFFQVGEKYIYELGKEKRTYQCTDKFSSLDEASTIDSRLKNESSWYELSPHETLSLGNGPWKNQ